MTTASAETTPTRQDPPVAAEMPAAAQMHDVLRRRIITGDLLPGTRISEQDADKFDQGLSRLLETPGMKRGSHEFAGRECPLWRRSW